MDAFKGNEIARMEKGGNERWKRFWSEKNESGAKWTNIRGDLKAFEEVYGGIVGEEYRERLSCDVEGREFTGLKEKVVKEKLQAAEGMTGKSQKELNEDFFAKKGGENDKRRADLPPSKGGKYAGFGSEPMPSAGRGEGEGGVKGIPGVDEFQKDPVAALTKGFGWFTTTVGKGAKSVNDGWIQPNVQKVGSFLLRKGWDMFKIETDYPCSFLLCHSWYKGSNTDTNAIQLAEADLATQARLTAAQVAQNIQSSSKNAAEQFNRFLEDSSSSHPNPPPKGKSRAVAEPEHKDFWDSFGSPGGDDSNADTSTRNSPIKQAPGRASSPLTKGRASPAPSAKGNAIGTAAMRKGPKEKEEDKWDDF
ncbi:MAG: hypothetical protein Q9170_006653 [Blastenia crenularia]